MKNFNLIGAYGQTYHHVDLLEIWSKSIKWREKFDLYLYCGCWDIGNNLTNFW